MFILSTDTFRSSRNDAYIPTGRIISEVKCVLMQIAICEKSGKNSEELTDLLKEYFSDKSLTFFIECFRSNTDLLYEVQDGKRFDIVFLENPPLSNDGIVTAKKLRKSSYMGEIIFSANTYEHAVDGYDVDACGYIVKPIKRKKLFDIMDRATRKFDENVYYIRQRSDIIALPLNEILYIESSNSKCIIHSRSGEKFTVYTQLRKIENELNDSRFLRCHQSYIVNMNHIYKADKCFELTNGEKVLIRQRNLKEIRGIYFDYIDVR